MTTLGSSKANMPRPFVPTSRSRSTSAGSSEANQHEEELNESTRPRVYPSLLDPSSKAFQEEEMKGMQPKLSSGVLGIPDIEYPTIWQLDSTQTRSCPSSSIGAPPGLEYLDETERGNLTELSTSPASVVEPPPGLQNNYNSLYEFEIPIAPMDWATGHSCQLYIPPVHSFVPPPPMHSPTLPPEITEAMEPPLQPSMLASLGSVNHELGTCKPCAFIHTKGCQSGVECPFCHLCPPGEKKRRSKMTKQIAKLSAEAVFGTMPMV